MTWYTLRRVRLASGERERQRKKEEGEKTYMCMIISAINMYVQHRYKQINFLVTLTHTPVQVYRIATMTVMIIRFLL